MSFIHKVIRPDVRAVQAYHVPEFSGYLKMDAMENPYILPPEMRVRLAERLSHVALNRYPVPSYTDLKHKICQKMGVAPGYRVVLGNGSDELISLISVACARQDRRVAVMAPVPTFVMYATFAQWAGLHFVGVDLRPDFSLDIPAMLAAIAQYQPAVLYLSYPNNPTGNLFERSDVLALLSAMENCGIVVCDEAYQPFAQASMMDILPDYPNLVVMRTVSKLGLAGIRLGYLSAQDALLDEWEKVRPPYNVNVLTEAAASFALDHMDVFEQQASALRGERAVLSEALAGMPDVQVMPSSANFLLIRIKNADQVFKKLVERGILVRNVSRMHRLLENCLRVTVSTREENELFLAQFKACLD
jgi:histidinol-phosphate aminotransferase